ncbi:D-sedoheptulose 7-phosphate isomerase [Candidatus Nitronereus thalassa]|uniref:Phosphoheptose isomerase n=1 Tax=Candidatus Nitronereus thalassa TaxID=3020898 RepID=A0ABU3K9C4_9BACT|nr:D-sedoheptulose 7-phosphate isomerase [Candidatus Nitronereus thalassa]MDT7043060.1 D-sedoheptulose 7-phosphate isomerase [Candidatus Nitronereus thalassa]
MTTVVFSFKSILESGPMNIEQVAQRFRESGEVKQAFVNAYAGQIVKVAELIVASLQAGGKILLFGNGGSATDASHIAAEFVGRYDRDRTPLPALALGTDMAAITCIANDYEYADIFSRQIMALGRKGDIAIAISTSGNSPNVLKAVETAQGQGLTTVAWTGKGGGKLGNQVDYPFVVPSKVTARIQECHITLGHVLCEIVEQKIFANAT